MNEGEPRSETNLSLADISRNKWDAVIVGAGHNGLVAGLVLARAGLSVLMIEGEPVVGGAVRTEKPFAKAPELSTSTGAYLLGLMQPELLERLQLKLPLLRRDPHYFLPTTDGRYLLFGSDEAELERQFKSFFSERDWVADRAMNRELAALREDIAKTWLSEPLGIEATAETYVRPELREHFINLCRGSVGDYLERFQFKSDLVKAMYAVTDGFSGLYGTWNTPGTGMNFLIHNMCRLKGGGGTWMIVEGGMGTITRTLKAAYREAGGELLLKAPVQRVLSSGGAVTGVVLEGDVEIRAGLVVAGCDPYTLRDLVGEAFPAELSARLDAMHRPGSTFKLNLALKALPEFTCLRQNRGQFGPTIHLLPDEAEVMATLDRAFDDVVHGKLPEFPTVEWYVHSTVDPTLSDAQGRLSSALFVQWVPYALANGANWDDEAERYSDHLLSICDRFAPNTSDLVVDRMALHPQRIEQYFRIRHGHIHHIDNSYGFAERFPHRLPLAGLYSCSAGTHPAGSVIGSAGFIAAGAALSDCGKPVVA